jgi:actin-related protein 5
MKTEDPQAYLKSLYNKRKLIYGRMERRKEQKEMMSKRDGFKRKMKTIAEMGAINDDEGKKRGDDEDDNFGANDDDWQLYKTIAKPGYEEDDEEEDQQALDEINEKIAEVDPNFA